LVVPGFPSGIPKQSPPAQNNSIWSGTVLAANAGSFNTILGIWKIPAVSPSGTPGLSEAAVWVGLDGFGEADVLQGGTTSFSLENPLATLTTYAAWHEWFPIPAQFIQNFPVLPGDDIFQYVWFEGPVGKELVVDMSLGIATVTNDPFPSWPFSNLHLSDFHGDEAEWIVERPSVNGSPVPLAKYAGVDLLGSADGPSCWAPVNPACEAAQMGVIVLEMSNNNKLLSVPTKEGISKVHFTWEAPI
jgi:hypothetical protein